MLVLATVALALVLFSGWHRLHRVPQRPNAFSPPVALFVLGMIYLLAPIGLSIAMSVFRIRAPESDAAAPLALDDTWKLQCGAMAARLLGVAAYFAMLRAAPPLLHDRRAKPMAAIALGVAGLLLTWPMVVASVEVVRWMMNAPDDPIAHDTLRQLVSQPLTGWGWAMIVGVTVVGPLTEEVMYRGLLQDGLRRAGATPWVAITLASTIFALAHVNVVPPHGLVGLFVLALGFGWSFERAGSLWAPLTMHALFNAGNLLLAQNIGSIACADLSSTP